MSWPVTQPDLAVEAIWRAAIRSVMPVSGELGYTEGRGEEWIRQRVTLPTHSLSWVLGRMVDDGELDVELNGALAFYRLTGAVVAPTNGPTIEPGAITPGTDGYVLQTVAGVVDWVASPAGSGLTHPQVLARGLGA